MFLRYLAWCSVGVLAASPWKVDFGDCVVNNTCLTIGKNKTVGCDAQVQPGFLLFRLSPTFKGSLFMGVKGLQFEVDPTTSRTFMQYLHFGAFLTWLGDGAGDGFELCFVPPKTSFHLQDTCCLWRQPDYVEGQNYYPNMSFLGTKAPIVDAAACNKTCSQLPNCTGFEIDGNLTYCAPYFDNTCFYGPWFSTDLCDTYLITPAMQPALAKMGAPCTQTFDCEGIVYCSPPFFDEGGDPVPQTCGGLFAGCADDAGCANELSCISHVCMKASPVCMKTCGETDSRKRNCDAPCSQCDRVLPQGVSWSFIEKIVCVNVSRPIPGKSASELVLSHCFPPGQMAGEIEYPAAANITGIEQEFKRVFIGWAVRCLCNGKCRPGNSTNSVPLGSPCVTTDQCAGDVTCSSESICGGKGAACTKDADCYQMPCIQNHCNTRSPVCVVQCESGSGGKCSSPCEGCTQDLPGLVWVVNSTHVCYELEREEDSISGGAMHETFSHVHNCTRRNQTTPAQRQPYRKSYTQNTVTGARSAHDSDFVWQLRCECESNCDKPSDDDSSDSVNGTTHRAYNSALSLTSMHISPLFFIALLFCGEMP